ncbi:MAG: tetratricopeptide repeat protein [Planctomycetota bacterium]|nr:MAG: tetratricopeptide repeat protein [Planctomycetota bacterium]
MKLWIATSLVLAVFLAGCASLEEKVARELNAGKEAIDKGKYEEAVTHYRKAIEYRSNDWRAYAECGDAHYFLKQYEPAIECYDNALIILGLMIIPQYLERSRRKNFSKLAVNADIKWKYQPMEVDILFKRGCALIELKRYKKASESLEICVNVRPSHLHAWSVLAELFDDKLKDRTAARYCYTRFLTLALKATHLERQRYKATKARIAHAYKRRRELTPEPEEDTKTAEAKAAGLEHELLCVTEDAGLRSEIMKMLTVETGKLGLKVELEKSTIRIFGKKVQLEPLRDAILEGFPKRLDRLELEIKKIS